MAAIVAAVAVLLSKVLPIPYLAAPFILSFWVLYAIADSLGMEKVQFGDIPGDKVTWIASIFAAAGGALFVGTVLSGMLFLFGVALSNWRHAVIVVFAVLITHWIAFQGQVAPGAINAGLIGFNAVLCSIAVYSILGGRIFG